MRVVEQAEVLPSASEAVAWKTVVASGAAVMPGRRKSLWEKMFFGPLTVTLATTGPEQVGLA
jgi:hypothetical protein